MCWSRMIAARERDKRYADCVTPAFRIFTLKLELFAHRTPLAIERNSQNYHTGP
jgi:hypothetical protein